MSLDKAIEHGKEKRKPYYGAQAIDCTCRPHGSCEWCRSNRLYQQLKMEEASRQALEEMNDGYVELDELFNVFTEIDARYSTNNLVIPEYQSLSWVDLCNKGIELLKKLRDE